MELTGKCEQDFEKWFNGNISKEDEMYSHYLKKFYEMHSSMKWGVYLDFFDSVGTRISIIDKWPKFKISFSLYDGDNISIEEEFDSRGKAQIAAIEKANQLYNNQP